MKKDEFVERYGIVAYEKQMKRVRDWRLAHPENNEKWHAQILTWRHAHPEKIKQYQQEYKRKKKQLMKGIKPIKTKRGEFIKRWGIEVYKKLVEEASGWSLANPEKVKDYQREYGKKGDNFYCKKLICDYEGLSRTRGRIFHKYGSLWKKYKSFVALRTRLHYEWIPDIDECKCIALVERDQTQYSFKDIINIPVIYKGKILKYLIPKRWMPKCLILSQRVPVFTDKGLQAGIGK